MNQNNVETEKILNPSALPFRPPWKHYQRRSFPINALPSNGVVILRQPKGPVPEEELALKNFASRIRRRAIGALLSGNPNRKGVTRFNY